MGRRPRGRNTIVHTRTRRTIVSATNRAGHTQISTESRSSLAAFDEDISNDLQQSSVEHESNESSQVWFYPALRERYNSIEHGAVYFDIISDFDMDPDGN